jgi:hypothetical protein
MSKNLLLILCVVLLTGCLETELEIITNKAIQFVTNDNKIDADEYASLEKMIKNSDDSSLERFKKSNSQLKDDVFISYLFKYFKAKNITITENDIWSPNNKNKKFNINVFLENSSSMDGYVKGITRFETAIYNLLGDFKISGICDSLNLNYINKQVYIQNKNALSADIEDFIQKLEPSTFKARGGDRSVSDLENIFKTVLNTVNKKNVSILVSDFVFSPGKNVNAQDYLNNQSVGIKIDFAEKLNRLDLHTMVVKLESNFNGTYYDKKNIPINYSGKRPYYVWIFGNRTQIEKINELKIIQKIKGGYLNKLVFQPTKNKRSTDFKILIRPKIGEFISHGLNKKMILEAETENSGQNKQRFGFTLAVNFNKELQEQSYYLNKSNYAISNKQYELTSEINSNPSLSAYSHILKLKTNNLNSESLQIDVLGKIPKWVYSSSSNDDSNIAFDLDEQQKTFGLKYLIEGVSDAYYSKSNVINSMKVLIKK